MDFFDCPIASIKNLQHSPLRFLIGTLRKIFWVYNVVI